MNKKLGCKGFGSSIFFGNLFKKLESYHNFMLAGTCLDDDIVFKKRMTAGFVGDDLLIESMRESCKIHTSV